MLEKPETLVGWVKTFDGACQKKTRYRRTIDY